MDDLSKELQDLHNAVGNQIHEACYFKTLEIVEHLGSPELVDGSVPLEAWMELPGKGPVQLFVTAPLLRRVKGWFRTTASRKRGP
jgi:hypothetical protein